MISIDVQKRLGDFQLAAEFDAPQGVTAVFGHSGAGKTSLIRMIAGLEKPDKGRIAIGDQILFDNTQNLPPHRRRLGVVFQDARLFPHMNVAKNLTYGGDFDHERIVDLLGLNDLLHRMPARLSGGEAQRVALGRALMSDPQMLLLDEPLAALDSARKAEILPYFERLRDELGLPMIYVSHSIREVARLANSVVVLEHGKVALAGPTLEVLSNPASMRMFGVRDAGAVVAAVIDRHIPEDGLTVLAFDGGSVSLPQLSGAVGAAIRLRIPAQDVILAVKRPVQISARNILNVTISTLDIGRGPGVVVGLLAGKTPLLARITKASLRDLDLTVGDQIFAIIKATATSNLDVGHTRG